jgi:hypothetical protein
MNTIIVTDQAYRVAANADIFHSMGVKLDDGSWSVLVKPDAMARIMHASRGDESYSETILRLALPCRH